MPTLPEQILNARPAASLKVRCSLCRGRGCDHCYHTGYGEKRACGRCGGTGSDSSLKGVPPRCLDCKGDGWRDIDNVKNWDQ